MMLEVLPYWDVGVPFVECFRSKEEVDDPFSSLDFEPVCAHGLWLVLFCGCQWLWLFFWTDCRSFFFVMNFPLIKKKKKRSWKVGFHGVGICALGRAPSAKDSKRSTTRTICLFCPPAHAGKVVEQ
ncbi:hypothetical protein V6N11_020238 [Hibiscus sabdariffa]|uniref:Uncharacterized protein n=1 Tax=Hibiscus sabdariffa TaxID=183260 RepID=A0ABR2Q878_9ROSI